MAHENLTNQTEKSEGVREVVRNLFLTVHAIMNFIVVCVRGQ